MVDVEPTPKTHFSIFNIKSNLKFIVALFLICFISPIHCIINNHTYRKEMLQQFCNYGLEYTNTKVYKVSKQDVIQDPNIMYFCNHTSFTDFFVDAYTTNYSYKGITLNLMILFFPFMCLLSQCTVDTVFVSIYNNKETIKKQFELIEKKRLEDKFNNIFVYPEGMRRPHRPYPSPLKKGFIYHSYEKNIPIQIIHTTNKEYCFDEFNFTLHDNPILFTYYSKKIDPIIIKNKYLKKNKECTREDYVNEITKIWNKIWKKMDKFRIDSYKAKNKDYIQKFNTFQKKYSYVENKITNDSKINYITYISRYIFLFIIYLILYLGIHLVFSILHRKKKKGVEIYKDPSITWSIENYLKYMKKNLYNNVL